MAKADGRVKENLNRRFENICLEKGIRVTPQRLRIYRAVSDTRRHPTAEMIYEELRDEMPGLSLNTVYRTLETFERLGVIDRLPAPAHSARFDGETQKHHHIVCDRCGAIADVEWPEFEKLNAPKGIKNWGEIDRAHVYFVGRCGKCLDSDSHDSIEN